MFVGFHVLNDAAVASAAQTARAFAGGRLLRRLTADTGRFLWGYNRVANNVPNITSPLIRGDYVFALTAYNTDSVLLRIMCEGSCFGPRRSISFWFPVPGV